MFDQRKCYGDVTCEQTSSSLFMKYHTYFGIILMLNHSQVESLSKNYYKVRWNYYKLRQLSLLQSAMDRYYKLRQLFYYKVRQGLLQIMTGITKCDDCYKLRQCKGHLNQWCTLFYIFAQERCSSTLFAFDKRF